MLYYIGPRVVEAFSEAFAFSETEEFAASRTGCYV